MGRRTVLLIASILVAAVGTALIFMYVRGADDRANEGREPISVVVASKEIGAGQSVKASGTSFTLRGIPKIALPGGGSYYSGNQGLNALNARTDDVAVRAIPAGSIIAPSDFSGSDEVSAAGLAKGQVEMAVEITDPNRVAGALKPGAKVAVIVTTDPTTIKELAGGDPRILQQLGVRGSAGQDAKVALTSYLLSGITVMRVGGAAQAQDSGTSEAVDSKIIALAVSPHDALTLRAGEKVGELSLAILGPDTTIPVTGNFPLIKVLGGAS